MSRSSSVPDVPGCADRDGIARDAGATVTFTSTPTPTATLATLAHEMAELLAPRIGAEAAREARELLAALHDMPRHWPALARASAVDDAMRQRALAAATRRASGAPLQYAAGRAAFRHLTLD